MHKIFVYGTLKSNFYGPSHFSSPGRRAITTDKFLVMGEGFPRAVLASSLPHLAEYGEQLYGEVYEVNDEELAGCDMYESHPHYYKRVLTTVQYLDKLKGSGQKEEVEMYHATGSASCFDIFDGDDEEKSGELAKSLLSKATFITPIKYAINWS